MKKVIQKAVKINNYGFKQSDHLLLDANIWLYIYGPQQPNKSNVTIYSEALKRILDARSNIYIDTLILSEFINRYSRDKYNLISKGESFKEFRRTPSFKEVAKEISEHVRRILKCCKRIESGFELLEIDELINEYEAGTSDFNDQVLSELCKTKGFKFVTHDSDFHGKNITIITANKKMIKCQP